MARTLILVGIVASIGCAHARPKPAAGGLTIMTYNVWAWGSERRATLELIEAVSPDVLLLQEVTNGWARHIDKRLRAAYPHVQISPHRGAYGSAILSRYPLGRAYYLRADSGPVFGHCTDVRYPAPFTLCNLHLQSPRGAYVGKGDLSDGLDKNEVMRQAQWRVMCNWLDKHAGKQPRIVAGDTNTPGYDDLNDSFAEHYVDAQAEASLWTDSTWPHDALPSDSWARWVPTVPFVRLDYIWVSPTIEVAQAEVINGGSSDHLPVWAELIVPAGPET